jgi:hypothetical protein
VRWAPAAAPSAAAGERVHLTGGRLSVASAPVPEGLGTSWAGATSRLTWLHLAGNEANRLLVVGVSIKDTSTTVTGVTYGGAPLTFLGASGDESRSARVELWYLTAPASGLSSIRITLSAAADVIGGALTFSGVDQAMPLGGFAASGSNGPGATDPSVVVTNAGGGLVIGALAVAGSPGLLTPAPGLVQKWIGFQGTGHTEIGAIAPGADTVAMGWTKTSNAKWAMGAVAIHGATVTGPPLDQFQVRFTAVRGQTSSVQINYQGPAGSAAQPFLRLDVTDPVFVPGRGDLSPGDSVTMTVTVDPVNVLVNLEPSGIRFGQPAALSMWYGGAGGDLNGDGVVDRADADIESGPLTIWCLENPGDPWWAMSTVRSTLDRTLIVDLQHFSNYAVAY